MALHLIVCMRRIAVVCWANGLVPRLGSLAPPVCCDNPCASGLIPFKYLSGSKWGRTSYAGTTQALAEATLNIRGKPGVHI